MARLAPRLVLAMAACAGCSYDWDIGVALTDAGEGGADSPRDAVTEGVSDSAQHRDAPLPDDAMSCPGLVAGLDAAKMAAIACSSTSSDCMTQVTDECGCNVWVAQPANFQTLAYTAAVAAVRNSGCALNCSTCPTPASQSSCVGMTCTQ